MRSEFSENSLLILLTLEDGGLFPADEPLQHLPSAVLRFAPIANIIAK